MQGSELVPFTDALRGAFAAHNKAPNEATLRAFYDGLKDLPLETVVAALAKTTQESTYGPNIARIRQAAQVVRADGVTQDAAVARGLAMKAAGEVWCRDCDDTGWRPGEDRYREDLYGEGPLARVTTVAPCPCRSVNLIYRAKRASERRWGTGQRGDDQ